MNADPVLGVWTAEDAEDAEDARRLLAVIPSVAKDRNDVQRPSVVEAPSG